MKLHYSVVGTAVAVSLFRGETFSAEDKEVLAEVTFDSSVCPAELADGDKMKSLAAYGLLKLLQDRTSQVKGAKEKLEEMQMYFNDFFSQGLWKKPSEGRKSTGASAGGSRRKITASLAEAVAQLQGISAVEAQESLKALDKDTFERIAKNPKVVAKIAEIEAAASVVDLGDLLGDEAAAE